MCECDERTQKDKDRTEERRLNCIRDCAVMIIGISAVRLVMMPFSEDYGLDRAKSWVFDMLECKYGKETVGWVRKHKDLVSDEIRTRVHYIKASGTL